MWCCKAMLKDAFLCVAPILISHCWVIKSDIMSTLLYPREIDSTNTLYDNIIWVLID